MNLADTHSAIGCMLTAATFAILPGFALAGNAYKSVSGTLTPTQAQTGTGETSATAKNIGNDATATVSPEKDAYVRKTKDKRRTPAGSYLLVPMMAPEQNQWMKKGCWAKFYDNQNYSGDNITLMGPVDMPDMTGPFGINWKGKISSVETGSKARVLIYDNENYKDLVATFKPGQKSADVNKKMGFFDEFASLKIACDNLKAPQAPK